MAENFIQATLDKTSSLNKPAPRPPLLHLYPSPQQPQQCAANILQSLQAHQHRSIPKLAQHSKKTDAAVLAARATDAATTEKRLDERDKKAEQPQRQDGSQSDKINWEYWYSTAIGYFADCQTRLGCDITPGNCDYIRTQLDDTTALNAAIAANSRLFAAINDSLQTPVAVDGATSARPSAAAGDQKKVEEVEGVGPVKEGGVSTRMKTERKADSDAKIRKLEKRIEELEERLKECEARFIPGLKEAYDHLLELNTNLAEHLSVYVYNLDQTTKDRDNWIIKAKFNKSAFITARKECERQYYQLQASLQSIAELTRRNADLAVRHAEVSGRATKAEQAEAELQATLKTAIATAQQEYGWRLGLQDRCIKAEQDAVNAKDEVARLNAELSSTRGLLTEATGSRDSWHTLCTDARASAQRATEAAAENKIDADFHKANCARYKAAWDTAVKDVVVSRSQVSERDADIRNKETVLATTDAVLVATIAERDALAEERTRLNTENAEAEQQRRADGATIEDLQYQVASLTQERDALSRDKSQLDEEKADAARRERDDKDTIAYMQAQFASLTADRDGFAMQITQLNTDAANNTSSIADKDHAIGRADTEIARLHTEVSDLRARLRAADVSLETSKSTVADRERELTTARIQTMSYTARLETSTAHTESQDKQIATLQSTVASRDVQISHLSTENAVLVDRHASRAEEAAGYLETLKARIEDVTRLQRAGTDAAVKLAEAEQREAGARDESTRLQTRIDTLTVELQAARTQIADNNAVISDQACDLAARHDMVATDASAKARWDTMATEAQSKSSMLAIRVVILEAEVNAAKSEARDCLASAEAQGQEIAAQIREIASLKARVENVKETLRIVGQNFAFAQTKITRLEDEKHRLERQRANDDIRADGTTARKSIRLSKDSAATATAMDTVGDITAKDDEITRLRASVEANATAISSKDSIIADYSTQIGDLTQRLTATTRDLETTNQALATTKAHLKSANDLTQQLTGELFQAQASEASIRKIDNDLATKHMAFVHSTHLVFEKIRDNTGTYLAEAFEYCIGLGIFAKENLYVTGLPEYADPVG